MGKVVIIAFVATTLITWPFLPYLASFYTDQGDYATHGSILWWNADSIKTGRIFNQEEYFKGYQFYPHPYSLAFANNHVFPSLIFSPLYWITNNLPFSFNTYLFLTFVASFLAAFYMVKFFLILSSRAKRSDLDLIEIATSSPAVRPRNDVVSAAAMVGAFIFAFNPQTMTRFPQHIELLGKFFLPLIFLFGYKFLEKPSLKNGFWLFLFITLNSLTANYFQVFVAIMLPLVSLPFLIKAIKKGDLGYLGRLGKFGLVGLIFLPILLYFNIPFWEFAQKEGAFRSIEESIFFSGRINDWLAPPQNNLVYSSWSSYLHEFREPKDNRGILNYEEHTLFIGVLATILFFIGLKEFYGSRVKHGMTRTGKWYFLILLIVPFVLIFGPFFPPSEDGMKLPFYFLYEWIPIMKGIRAPIRFEYIFIIPFALICAYGAQVIIQLSSSRMRGSINNVNWIPAFAGMTMLVILILENFTIKDFSSRSTILQKLDDQTVKELSFLRGKATLHLPVYTIDDADVFGKNSYVSTWVTQTGERVVNGNSGYFPPDSLELLFEIREDINEEVLKKLSMLGVSYVIFHTDMLSKEEWAGLVKNSSLYEKAIVYNDDELFIVDLSKYNFNITLCDFDNLESREVEIDGEISLILTNQADCYLPNIYRDRYRGYNGKTYRMPLILGPKEQIVAVGI